MIPLIILVILIVGLGKYLGAEQAAAHRRELAALRKELEGNSDENNDDGEP